jgi:hypothetical protein
MGTLRYVFKVCDSREILCFAECFVCFTKFFSALENYAVKIFLANTLIRVYEVLKLKWFRRQFARFIVLFCYSV